MLHPVVLSELARLRADELTPHAPTRVRAQPAPKSATPIRFRALRVALAGAAIAGVTVAFAACGGEEVTVDRGAAVRAPAPLDATEIIERARPGVVQIYGKTSYGTEASGTGWVLRATKDEAIVVTAAHVVSSLRTIRVNPGGKPSVAAKVLASFPCQSDLAVLKLTDVPDGLRALPLADAGGHKSGEPVYTVGYPSTAKQSHSEPATSSEGTIANPLVRNVTGGADIVRLRSALIHNAAIAPGSSGGPLFNRYGQVIGVNVMSNSSSAVQNQNYAVPIADVARLLPAGLKGESPSWGVGLYPARQLDVRGILRAEYGNPHWARYVHGFVQRTGGLFVIDAEPGGAADKAHLDGGDYITSINGTKVNSVTAACDVMQSQSSGDTVVVKGYQVSGVSYARSGASFKRRVRVP